MFGPLGVVVLPFRPTFRIERRAPYHHVQAARRWCRKFGGSPNFIVTTFIEGCSRSDPGRSDTEANFLRSLPTIDVVWTDGSVPSGGAGIHAVCGRCSSSSSLSYSAGPVSSSFSAESSALIYDLEWCHSHLKSCHFQSALFLTDLQSALTLLVPGHAGLPGNEVQTRLPKPEQHSPFPMFPVPWLRLLQRLYTLATLCGDEIFFTTPFPARFLRFPRRNWLFLVLSAVNCLDFAATVTAFSYPLTYAG